MELWGNLKVGEIGLWMNFTSFDLMKYNELIKRTARHHWLQQILTSIKDTRNHLNIRNWIGTRFWSWGDCGSASSRSKKQHSIVNFKIVFGFSALWFFSLPVTQFHSSFQVCLENCFPYSFFNVVPYAFECQVFTGLVLSCLPSSYWLTI